MTTPIARMEMAIEGRTKFVGDILKAVFGESEEEKAAKKLAEAPSNPPMAAEQIMAFFDSRVKRQARLGKKAPTNGAKKEAR